MRGSHPRVSLAALGAVCIVALVLATAASARSSDNEEHFSLTPSSPALGISPHVSPAVVPPRQLVAVLIDTGWPLPVIPEALHVIECESDFQQIIVGDAGEYGLFQIHPVHLPRFTEKYGVHADPFDPHQNAAVALDIWRDFGWSPWSCAP